MWLCRKPCELTPYRQVPNEQPISCKLRLWHHLCIWVVFLNMESSILMFQQINNFIDTVQASQLSSFNEQSSVMSMFPLNGRHTNECTHWKHKVVTWNRLKSQICSFVLSKDVPSEMKKVWNATTPWYSRDWECYFTYNSLQTARLSVTIC